MPEGKVVLPRGLKQADAVWRVIVDPIDGTRGLMYQKRSGWILTGVARNRGDDTTLADIDFAMQTEIPLVKQHLSDCAWAFRGQRAHAERYNRLTGETSPLSLQPSSASTIEHGYAQVARFFPGATRALSQQGVSAGPHLLPGTVKAIRDFLDRWIQRVSPVYLAGSLPAEFEYPTDDMRGSLLREVVLPTAKDHGVALTLMVGVRRGVNPNLKEAGDALGRADVTAIERLCAEHPETRFLVTFLSRENQHELCVAARKFSNLMPFGCWWFLNNPSIDLNY